MKEYQLELDKYGLKIRDVRTIRLYTSKIVIVTVDGELWQSKHLKTIWDGRGGYPGMANAMHNDLRHFAPESTQIVVVDSGDNIKKRSYIMFVFGTS